MSTIDTSTWNPDPDLNESIEGIPLNADASIAQAWQAFRILMAALKGDGDAIKGGLVPFSGATASTDGDSGFVPAPLAGDQDKVLRGDGTWGAAASASTAAKTSAVAAVGETREVVVASMAGSDGFRLVVGDESGGDSGYVEFATGDNGSEPIYFRQYSGANFASVARTLALLDGSGNTTFPGTVTTPKAVVGGPLDATGQVTINRNNSSPGGGLRMVGSAQNYAISILNTLVTKGSAPAYTRYWGIEFYGKDTEEYTQRIAMVDAELSTSNVASCHLRAYNCSSNKNSASVAIGVLMDGSGNGYTYAPTPAATDDSTKIATTAWVRTHVASGASSDERLKTPLLRVPDDVLDAWEGVHWGQFQFLDAVDSKGEAARLHLGIVAQRVKRVFEDRGLDACQYGLLCLGEDGYWSVRYAEALAMEAVCQRRRADRLEARIAALEVANA